MKTQPRIIRSTEEMYPIIETYLASGLTQKQFYEQNEIPHSVFSYWLRHYRKYKGLSSENPSAHFLPLTVGQVSSCTISLAGGISIRIEGLSNGQLRSFVTGLFSV